MPSQLLPSIRYACLYWIHHVVRGKEQVCDGAQIRLFLQDYFLHWLEALCLLGQATNVLGIFRQLHDLVKASFQFNLQQATGIIC